MHDWITEEAHLMVFDNVRQSRLSDQIRTGHAKQLCAKVEPWCNPFLFLSEPLLPLFFRQTGTLASVLSLLQILLEPPIALGHLPLTKLVTILFLL
jgi:hypothetical protein